MENATQMLLTMGIHTALTWQELRISATPDIPSPFCKGLESASHWRHGTGKGNLQPNIWGLSVCLLACLFHLFLVLTNPHRSSQVNAATWNSMMKESSLGKIPVAFNGQATAIASRQSRNITLVITTTQSSFCYAENPRALVMVTHGKLLLPLCSEELEADLQIRNQTVASSERPHLAWTQVQITDESLITRWFTTPTTGRDVPHSLTVSYLNNGAWQLARQQESRLPFLF